MQIDMQNRFDISLISNNKNTKPFMKIKSDMSTPNSNTTSNSTPTNDGSTSTSVSNNPQINNSNGPINLDINLDNIGMNFNLENMEMNNFTEIPGIPWEDWQTSLVKDNANMTTPLNPPTPGNTNVTPNTNAYMNQFLQFTQENDMNTKGPKSNHSLQDSEATTMNNDDNYGINNSLATNKNVHGIIHSKIDNVNPKLEYTPLLSPTVHTNQLKRSSISSNSSSKQKNVGFSPLSSPVLGFNSSLRKTKMEKSSISTLKMGFDNSNDNDKILDNSSDVKHSDNGNGNHNNENRGETEHSYNEDNDYVNNVDEPPTKRSKTPSSTPKLLPNPPSLPKDYDSGYNANMNSFSKPSLTKSQRRSSSRNSVLINPNHLKSANSSPVILPSSSVYVPPLDYSERSTSFQSADNPTQTLPDNSISAAGSGIGVGSGIGMGVGTNILSANAAPTPSHSKSYSQSSSPFDKKTTHKLAEQGRRNRMNYAVQQLDKLIPESMKVDISVPSKATTVEMGCKYILQLLDEIERLKKEDR